MTPEKFMARAIEIGREGLHEKHARPFAAVIVKQGADRWGRPQPAKSSMVSARLTRPGALVQP
jgi:tRNA(Arg) A34 adenosine deaminase TadA